MIRNTFTDSIEQWNRKFRRWQSSFSKKGFEILESKKHCVIEACTGSGKTAVGAALAARLMDRDNIDEVMVMCPSVPIKENWRKALTSFGFACTVRQYDAADNNAFVVTMSGSLSDKVSQRVGNGKRRLVIIDEFHHAEDNKVWGNGVNEAVEKAEYAIFLSGTPWRTNGKIACLDSRGYYNKDGHVVPDLSYSYGDDLRESGSDRGTVDVEFLFMESRAKVIQNGVVKSEDYFPPIDDKLSSASERDDRKLGPHVRIEDAAISNNEMAQNALRAGSLKLEESRRQTKGKAIGLVVTRTIQEAKRVSCWITECLGARAEVIASPKTEDDQSSAEAARRLSKIREGIDRPDWIVSVGMVSEGVDIPDIKVVVYLSAITTPLYITQVVGRSIRRVSDGSGRYMDATSSQTPAYVIMPAHPFLVWIASKFEQEKKIAAQKSKETIPTDPNGEGGENFLPEYMVTGGTQAGIVAKGSFRDMHVYRMIEMLSSVDEAKEILTDDYKVLLRKWLYTGMEVHAIEQLEALCVKFGVDTKAIQESSIDYDMQNKLLREEATRVTAMLRHSDPKFKNLPDSKAFAGVRSKLNRMAGISGSFESATIETKRLWMKKANWLIRQCIPGSQ